VRILLDECIDRRLASIIPDHEVTTVPRNGWAGKQNGELLLLAAKEFDVFVTIDGNLSSQQNLGLYELKILVLAASTNRLADLEPLIPKMLAILKTAKSGTATTVEAD